MCTGSFVFIISGLSSPVDLHLYYADSRGRIGKLLSSTVWNISGCLLFKPDSSESRDVIPHEFGSSFNSNYTDGSVADWISPSQVMQHKTFARWWTVRAIVRSLRCRLQWQSSRVGLTRGPAVCARRAKWERWLADRKRTPVSHATGK